MNDIIFKAIINLLKTLDSFKGSTDGTIRIYDASEVVPAGYPCAYLLYDRTESREMANNTDKVTYFYKLKVIQEKISDSFGQAKAEEVSRKREYELSQLFRGKITLGGVAGVIRVLPVNTSKSYSENNTNIVLDITLAVDTAEVVSI